MFEIQIFILYKPMAILDTLYLPGSCNLVIIIFFMFKSITVIFHVSVPLKTKTNIHSMWNRYNSINTCRVQNYMSFICFSKKKPNLSNIHVYHCLSQVPTHEKILQNLRILYSYTVK
jgi:hypothetical protein